MAHEDIKSVLLEERSFPPSDEFAARARLKPADVAALYTEAAADHLGFWEKLARRDPSSLSQFGHLLETFVVGELVRQASWMDGIAAIGHWRTNDGDEIDIVIERDDGGVIAFEVKAAGQASGGDMRHLRKLRDALGERFLAGVALYTGTRAYNLEDRLHVMPIDQIWTPV